MVVRRLVLPLLIAAAAVLLPASVATAASTKLIVSLKFPAFHGKLKSSRSSCTTGRTVKLFRKKAGPDQLLGTDRSNGKGKWSIPIGKPRPGASYYAKTPTRGSCGAAKSKVLKIG